MWRKIKHLQEWIWNVLKIEIVMFSLIENLQYIWATFSVCVDIALKELFI